jgi:hypothetical protein
MVASKNEAGCEARLAEPSAESNRRNNIVTHHLQMIL